MGLGPPVCARCVRIMSYSEDRRPRYFCPCGNNTTPGEGAWCYPVGFKFNETPLLLPVRPLAETALLVLIGTEVFIPPL